MMVALTFHCGDDVDLGTRKERERERERRRAFSVTENHDFNGPLGRSLCLFACIAHSLHGALLFYAHFTSSLTHFAHFLEGQFPQGMFIV